MGRNKTGQGKKKIGIFTWHDISSAYSCLLYLYDSLKDHNVDLWAMTRSVRINEKYRSGYHSFAERAYIKIRGARLYLSKIDVLLQARKCDLIVINDLDFFWSGYALKKLYPSKTVVHYNTEIPGEDVALRKQLTSFYEKHADYPDLIIECLKERAEYRKERYKISKEIMTIDNTIPRTEAEQILNVPMDVSSYFDFRIKGIPTVVYAGGVTAKRNIEDVIQCIGEYTGKVNLLLFCYGNEEQLQIIKDKCDKYENCYFHKAVDRNTLLHILGKCDIGLQYYDPDVSINHYLAAPSKLYEYIAVGLNILSSKNHGIDRIIEENDLGVCFTNDEGIKGGLEKLLAKGLNDREKIRSVFTEKLCYEEAAKETIRAIRSCLD